MKTVNEQLSRLLDREKHFLSCDLYALRLKSGVSYYYADTNMDVSHSGRVYVCNGPIIKRTQIKTSSQITVDKLSLTIHADERDRLGGETLMAVAHNGGFDGAVVELKRAFFREDGSLVGVIDVFTGECEVKSGGGLTLQLEVKSSIQKLATEWPSRRYYPQCPYVVYDNYCGVNIAQYKKRIRVASVPQPSTITVNVPVTNGYYDAGGIEWLSGALTGQSTQIMSSQNGQIVFMNPNDAQPQVGDEAYIYPGCDKTPKTCKEKFNNFSRNRATPYVPLKETIR